MKLILWIDDEKQITDLGEVLLSRNGYRVIVANNPIKGLSMVREYQPELVITDYMMPEKTGKSLSREIKKINKDIKIILCSGSEKELSKEILNSFGIELFLPKPFSMINLMSVVGEVFNQQVIGVI